MSLILPPLSLYVHIPWCVQKCPYCDFNSHTIKQPIPQQAYIQHLLEDLSYDLKYVQQRSLNSIFIGGGTPSVLTPDSIGTLLRGIEQRIPFADNIEITMEANPGSVEASHFAAYRQLGINRISIGIQSFNEQHLQRLGRVHNVQEARHAATLAHQIELNSFNLDLMHGLPQQSVSQAMADLQQAIDCNPPHISWYQLTIEPNTLFYSKPPPLPDDDILWEIQAQGHQLLQAHGYQQYEISAYSQPEQQCQHNLNYWHFGDYIGIGCEAHGKITLPATAQIIRTTKVKHPMGYMDLTRNYLHKQWTVSKQEQAFEYFMNRLRLTSRFKLQEVYQVTQLTQADIAPSIEQAIQQQLLTTQGEICQVTTKGQRYLNDLLALFI